MKRLLCLLTLIPLLFTACAAPSPSATATATASLLPTLPSTDTPTGTPAPPTGTATPRPIEGTLTIKVNVRSGPGTTYASLGQLNAGEKVRIMVRDASSAWFQVLYPSAPGGAGWVAAQYVQIPAGVQVPLEATPTPAGPVGRVLQRLNLRSGPGMSFPSLGTLAPDALVSLTGKNATASWFQVNYPSGPGGRAWVTAQYIQTDASDRLPVLDDYGTPVSAGTPGATPIPVTATPTLGPAYDDGDSASNPGVRVVFSAFGTRQFTYSSQVSAPQGDPADWVAFTPYAYMGVNARLVFSLACSGNGALTVELLQGSSPFSGWTGLACGDMDKIITLPAGQPYELHLLPAPGAGLQFVDYVLTVQDLP